MGYEIINLGSDQPIVLLDALRVIEGCVGKKAKLKFSPRDPADVMITWADINTAQRLLGWKPEHDFQQGVEALVAWYKANRSWAQEIAT